MSNGDPAPAPEPHGPKDDHNPDRVEVSIGEPSELKRQMDSDLTRSEISGTASI
jgi:hypothetical protein